ncbi:hypothetical protein QQ045_032115 [Rhodiola kirilowii]
MLTKWQLMAEQPREKLEGACASDSVTSSQPTGSSTSGATHGSAGKLGMKRPRVAPTKVDRKIMVKDVIAVLQSEPKMAKTPLVSI